MKVKIPQMNSDGIPQPIFDILDNYRGEKAHYRWKLWLRTQQAIEKILCTTNKYNNR